MMMVIIERKKKKAGKKKEIRGVIQRLKTKEHKDGLNEIK